VYEYGNSYEPIQGDTLFQNDSIAAGIPSSYWVNTHNWPNTQAKTAFRMPPSTIAEAKIMPNSHSWQAQDGSYNVAKFLSDNPFQTATRRNHHFAQNQPGPSTSVGTDAGWNHTYADSKCNSWISNNNLQYSGLSSLHPPFTWPQAGRTQVSRMNTTGVSMTGLSEQTSLFVTWKVCIERLPAAFNPTFLALARPSACLDDTAIKLYAYICCNMPPGVPQDYNDAGKWFQMVKSAASSVLPRLQPWLPMVSSALAASGRPFAATAIAKLASLSSTVSTVKKEVKQLENKKKK
jgi:hypothetical protein